MKFLLCVVAMTFPAITLAQEGRTPPLVTTSGTAEIQVVPDLAELYFEVNVRNASLDKARKLQARRAVKVLAALRAAGITETDLKAEQIEIRRLGEGYYGFSGGGGYFSVDSIPETKSGDKEPPEENVEDTSEEVEEEVWESKGDRDYVVDQVVQCHLKDLSKVAEITASLFEAGATSSRGATLKTSQLRKYRDEARMKAIRFAREKATALATELGARVGKPYMITEGESPGWWGQNNTNGGQGGSDGKPAESLNEAQPTFAPGTITVSATISVSFVLE